MPENLNLRNQNTHTSASANVAQEESSEGISLMPPPLSFDAPAVQMFKPNQASNSDAEDNETANGQNDANHDFRQGRRYFNIGNYQRALVFFQRALHQEGLNQEASADLLYNMGLCNYRLERFPGAINFFELYLTHNPGNEEVQNLLRDSRSRANATNSDGELNGENPYATEDGLTHENRPEGSEINEQAQATYQRALRQFRNGDYRSATYLFEQVRQAGTLSANDNADLLYNLGICNLRMRRYATAVTYLEQYLHQNPGNEEAENALQQAQSRSGI